jgi:hypothetical protein
MSIDFSTLPTARALSFGGVAGALQREAGRVQTRLRMVCASRSAWAGSALKHSFLRLMSECPRCRIGPSESRRAGPSSFVAATPTPTEGDVKSPKTLPWPTPVRALGHWVRFRQLSRGCGVQCLRMPWPPGRTVAEAAVRAGQLLALMDLVRSTGLSFPWGE